MSDQVLVSLITSVTAIIVSLIAAWSQANRKTAAAVELAVAPLKAEIQQKDATIADQGVLIQRQAEELLRLKGEPHDV